MNIKVAKKELNIAVTSLLMIEGFNTGLRVCSSINEDNLTFNAKYENMDVKICFTIHESRFGEHYIIETMNITLKDGVKVHIDEGKCEWLYSVSSCRRNDITVINSLKQFTDSFNL